MKTIKKILPYLTLSILTLFFCWLFVGRRGVFGSSVDWLPQHSVIPDYFRQQFYETGKFIPEFAPSLGGGQNIYNFAYYGLFSPLLLPSYLLPSVKISTYIMTVSILVIIASVLLLYYWLGTHGITGAVRLSSSVLLLLAGPMIFQSYRQFMFVNYMPFLILALIGVDIFWKKRRTMVMTSGIFLMIMTSFYFSISGMLVLFLYGIIQFPVKETHKIRAFFHFTLPFFTSVFTSAILLIPTACALLVRSEGSVSVSLKELLIPDFSLWHFMYTAYGIGLSLGILIVLFFGIFLLKFKEKLLCIICLILFTIPLFSWILNGGLYIEDKVFITFIPLLCYLTAVFLTTIQERLCTSSKLPGSASFRRSIPILLLMPFLAYLVVAGIHENYTYGEMLDKNFCKNIWDSSWRTEIESVLEKEQGVYRLEQTGTLKDERANPNRIWNPRQWTTTLYSSVYNHGYQEFLTDTFQVEIPFKNAISHSTVRNPLFRKFMGVKHLVKKEKDNDFSTKTLETAAPVLYSTAALISPHDYEKLSFPYNQTSLMYYAVADCEYSKKQLDLKELKDHVTSTEISISENQIVHKKEKNYQIRTNKVVKNTLQIETPGSDQKQIFFLQFDIDNHRLDNTMFIEVDGIRNKLSAADHSYYNGNTTFTYATVLKPGQTSVPIVFSKGHYTICNIRSYLGPEKLLSDTSLYQSEFIPDWNETKGNQIVGGISSKQDGYLITSIPFDKNFEILVDGQPVIPEIVNTAFLGFPITKGTHQINITYHAAGLSLGKILSCFGLLLWILSLFIDRAGYRKNYNQLCFLLSFS